MRAPRRVPWASRYELEELYDFLFSPVADLESRKRGLSRINVYLSSPSCPAFLPLLHGLVTASLLPTPQSPQESTSTRMTCAMAIVRFVNGMVDPLQVGAYARPISHLAATIGIPPMLITIRHRATHDDLPALQILQNSVNVAIEYLHHYAFLPLLASSSEASMNSGNVQNSMAEGIIKRWKKAMKIRVRDKVVGEENETGREIRKIKRDLELVDPEDIITALCTVEGIIPLARKKRPGFKTTVPTTPSLQLWVPLLEHLVDAHPSVSTLLAERIIVVLLDPSLRIAPFADTDDIDSSLARKEEQSARWCLATWLLWLWNQSDLLALDQELRSTITRQLLGSLLTPDPVIRRLHKSLVIVDEKLSDTSALNDLLPDLESDEELAGLDDVKMEDDSDIKFQEMERRLRLVENNQNTVIVSPVPRQPVSSSDTLPPGWRRLGEDWKPCPIGIWTAA